MQLQLYRVRLARSYRDKGALEWASNWMTVSVLANDALKAGKKALESECFTARERKRMEVEEVESLGNVDVM